MKKNGEEEKDQGKEEEEDGKLGDRKKLQEKWLPLGGRQLNALTYASYIRCYGNEEGEQEEDGKKRRER